MKKTIIYNLSILLCLVLYILSFYLEITKNYKTGFNSLVDPNISIYYKITTITSLVFSLVVIIIELFYYFWNNIYIKIDYISNLILILLSIVMLLRVTAFSSNLNIVGMGVNFLVVAAVFFKYLFSKNINSKNS
jgi:hypothetical protein